MLLLKQTNTHRCNAENHPYCSQPTARHCKKLVNAGFKFWKARRPSSRGPKSLARLEESSFGPFISKNNHGRIVALAFADPARGAAPPWRWCRCVLTPFVLLRVFPLLYVSADCQHSSHHIASLLTNGQLFNNMI